MVARHANRDILIFNIALHFFARIYTRSPAGNNSNWFKWLCVNKTERKTTENSDGCRWHRLIGEKGEAHCRCVQCHFISFLIHWWGFYSSRYSAYWFSNANSAVERMSRAAAVLKQFKSHFVRWIILFGKVIFVLKMLFVENDLFLDMEMQIFGNFYGYFGVSENYVKTNKNYH